MAMLGHTVWRVHSNVGPHWSTTLVIKGCQLRVCLYYVESSKDDTVIKQEKEDTG